MTKSMAWLDQLEVFYGETTAMVSRVYARLRTDGHPPGLSLSGSIRGPFCDFSQTLPVTTSFHPSAANESLLACATIPDPCFWTPNVPSLYQVHVELRQEGHVIETDDRQLGIRAFGPRGRSLYLNGQRWVPRGVTNNCSRVNDLSSFRQASAAMVIDDPDDSLCVEASRNGVLILSRAGNCENETESKLRRLGRCASVAVVIVQDFDHNLREVAPNLLIAQAISSEDPAGIAEWADLVVGTVNSPAQFGQRFAECELPVFALRRYDEHSSVAEARAACDALQRDLAPFGDFAGYIV